MIQLKQCQPDLQQSRPNTFLSYRAHLERHLKPRLGHLRLRDVRPTHVEAVLREAARPGEDGKRLSSTSIRRIHATLSSALASAVRRRLINYNPAANIDLPKASKPKVRPWEPEELGAFLDSLGGHPMAALFETIAATGLRRGEALGLRWEDLDVARGRLVVRRQLLQINDDSARRPCPYCSTVHLASAFGQPKTASGEARLVELDQRTLTVLRDHRAAQDRERDLAGARYIDHGLVFARSDGNPLPPEHVTKTFSALVRRTDLRPVRLHDLRHGAASLRLAAGVDIAVVSKQLGHSTIALTVDTYSHLLEGVGRDAAEKAMALVPREVREQSVSSWPSEATLASRRRGERPGHRGAPPGTRTPDPLIKSQLL